MTDDIPPPPEGYDPIAGEVPGALVTAVDARLVEWRDGYARMESSPGKLASNRQGLLHGGFYTIVLDTVACYTGTFCPYPGRVRRAVTLSLNTQFQGAARVGDHVIAEGRLDTGGRSVFFASATIRSEKGVLLASAQGVFKYRSGSTTPYGEPV